MPRAARCGAGGACGAANEPNCRAACGTCDDDPVVSRVGEDVDAVDGNLTVDGNGTLGGDCTPVMKDGDVATWYVGGLDGREQHTRLRTALIMRIERARARAPCQAGVSALDSGAERTLCRAMLLLCGAALAVLIPLCSHPRVARALILAAFHRASLHRDFVRPPRRARRA